MKDWPVDVQAVVPEGESLYVATPDALLMITSMAGLGTSVAIYADPNDNPVTTVMVRTETDAEQELSRLRGVLAEQREAIENIIRS